jgi:hypothetical protein
MGFRLLALRADRALPRIFLVLVSVRGLFQPGTTLWVEGLGQMDIPMTLMGVELGTLRLVAQCFSVAPTVQYEISP